MEISDQNLIFIIIVVIIYVYYKCYSAPRCIKRIKSCNIYYFYSPTCPYCTDVTPIFERLSKEISNKNGVKIIYNKVNMSGNLSKKDSMLIQKFKVSGMPTLIKTDVNGTYSTFNNERTYTNIKQWIL
jgi:thiol-disulfide isomerase/thioredoxin